MSDLISRSATLEILRQAKRDRPLDSDRWVISDIANKVCKLPEPSVEPEIIRCKECKHKPHPSDDYDYNNDDCGFEIIFPDYRCPCRCEDEYYNRIPGDDWYCGNAERRTDG